MTLSMNKIPAGTYFMPSRYVNTYDVSISPHVELAEGALCMLLDPIFKNQQSQVRFLCNEIVYSMNTKFLQIAETSMCGGLFIAIPTIGTTLIDKRICLTGEFAISRHAFEKMIELQGGCVDIKVRKNTSFLVTEVSNKTSGKLHKARRLGIPIISEKHMFSLAGTYLFRDFFEGNCP